MSDGGKIPLPAAALRRWTVRAQLVALVLAVTVPSAGLVVYALAAAAHEAREAAFAQVQALAAAAASRLDFVIRDNAALLDQVARRPRVRALDPRNCDPLLENLVALNPHYTTLGLRDREANTICSSRPDPLGAQAVSTFPWFRHGIAAASPLVGDAFLHPKSGRWVSVLTQPLTDDAGAVAGILALSLDLRSLQDRLFDALPEGNLVAVLDRRGVYLMRSADPDRWIGKPLPETQAARVASRTAGESFETVGVDGVARIYATALVPGAGWRVFAASPLDVVQAPHRERLVRSAGIGFATILVVIVLAYGIGAAIAGPIGDLARAAQALRGGQGLPSAPAEGAVEVEAVASELNWLAGEREQQRGERAALVAHYERMLKATRDIYLLVDPAGRVADFNDAAIEAYGFEAGTLRGMPLVELREPGARASFDEDWSGARKMGGGLFETVHRRRDGSTFPVEVSATSVVIDGAAYYQAFVRDTTARKATEAMLRRQNAELDRFNRAAVGRELDVIELKERVNALSRELGREPPFPLAFLDAGGGPPERP
jgi:PAS domain S-box-containing protein